MMGPTNCTVVNCFNNRKKLKYFKETPCEIETVFLNNDCGCEPPFDCICFLVSKETLKKSMDKIFEKSDSW